MKKVFSFAVMLALFGAFVGCDSPKPTTGGAGGPTGVPGTGGHSKPPDLQLPPGGAPK